MTSIPAASPSFPTAECIQVNSLREKYGPSYNLKKWVQEEGHLLTTRSGRVAIKGEGPFAYKASIWANPYPVGIKYSLQESLEKYEEHVRQTLYQKLPELAGKSLGCFCKEGTDCHTGVLIRLYKESISKKSSGKKSVQKKEEKSVQKKEEKSGKKGAPGICAATKKDGTPCTYKAKGGNFCGVHSK